MGPKPDGAEKEDRDLPRWVPWAIIALVIAAALVAFLLARTASTTQTNNETLTDQRDATAQQATTLADQVASACASGGTTAEDLRRVGACQQAAQVQSTPVPIAGPQGEPGPGPTDEQIAAAVAAWLFRHPPPAGRGPTAAEITAAVSEFLTANPPTPGRPPTAGEIAAAVSAWFVDHPVRDGVDGKDGEDGQDAPPPTAAEIQAAVDQHLAANPPPAGPEGPPGPICPAQTTLAQVVFQDGRTGWGCVDDVQPEPAPLIPPIGN